MINATKKWIFLKISSVILIPLMLWFLFNLVSLYDKTYEEVLAAAEAIKSKGLMEYPIAGTYGGWNLGLEFINMYLGHGGEFFESGSANPSINNAKGVATLNMMKSLSAYMNPDFLTYDSNAVQADWEAGNVALTNLWGSRAGAVTDGEGSTTEIEKNTKFTSAPTVAGGTTPSTTLWWDGITVASNISDEDAVATFIAMMEGISPATAAANPNRYFNQGSLIGTVRCLCKKLGKQNCT